MLRYYFNVKVVETDVHEEGPFVDGFANTLYTQPKQGRKQGGAEAESHMINPSFLPSIPSTNRVEENGIAEP